MSLVLISQLASNCIMANVVVVVVAAAAAAAADVVVFAAMFVCLLIYEFNKSIEW